jgi:hypothetical protein
MFSKQNKPSTALSSEMRRFSFARRCKESSNEDPPLSMYSKSGLFIESHVDIVSSVEMESPEFPGEAKLLKGTMAGTAIGTTVGTFRGGAHSFWAVLSWRDVTGAGASLVEADFVAEPRFALAFRALAKDPFFTGAAEVAEFNLCGTVR